MAETADAAKERGNAALKEKRYDDAVAAYTDAIRLDGSNHVFCASSRRDPAASRLCLTALGRADSNRSAAHAKKSKWVDALADAEKCIQLDASFARGYGRKGDALYGLGRLADAMVAINAGLKLDPGNASLQQKLQATESMKRKLESNTANYGRSQPAYSGGGPQRPSLSEWRPDAPSGLTRLFPNLAVVVFAVLYIIAAANPLSNDPQRYSHFGRAFMAALMAHFMDISGKWKPWSENSAFSVSSSEIK